MRIQHSDEYESYYSFVDRSKSLEHYGRRGMKWEQRLYQYKDGSLTPLGRIHYGVGAKRAKQMKEKGYTYGDYQGYKSYKKIQKDSGWRDRDYKLKKEAADIYNEDLVRNSAERRASREYYENMHRTKGLIGALLTKTDKNEIKALTDKYTNSEEYRRAKEFLDKHKDEFINHPKQQGDVDLDKWSKDITKDINNREVSVDSDGNYVMKNGKSIGPGYVKNMKELYSDGYSVKAISKQTGLSETAVNDILNGCHTNKYGDFVGVDGSLISAKGAEKFREMYKNGQSVEKLARSAHISLEMMKTVVGEKHDHQRNKELDDDYYNKVREYQNKVFNDKTARKMYVDIIEEIENDIHNNNKNIRAIYEDDGYIFTENGEKFKYKGKYVNSVSAYDELIERINRNYDKEHASEPSVIRQYQKRAKNLKKNGYTVEEIAKKLGVPVGTVSGYLY